MVCGLNEGELFILNVLRVNHNLSEKGSYNLKQIAPQFRAKFDADPNDVAKGLASKNYLTPKRKTDIKYWISDKPRTWYALGQHGFNVGNDDERRIIPRRVFRLSE
ncbi:MAG: hypothetical protein MUO26_12255 [Methanotrichaceae archaeon]|nr:hypothetical protein [Methanotrichaceae archaeon]